jgi:hypothetical protein
MAEIEVELLERFFIENPALLKVARLQQLQIPVGVVEAEHTLPAPALYGVDNLVQQELSLFGFKDYDVK